MSFGDGVRNWRTTLLGAAAGALQILAGLPTLTFRTALPALATALLGLFAKDA